MIRTRDYYTGLHRYIQTAERVRRCAHYVIANICNLQVILAQIIGRCFLSNYRLIGRVKTPNFQVPRQLNLGP